MSAVSIILCSMAFSTMHGFAQTQPPSTLSLIRTIGTRSELYSIAGISTDLRGNIFVTDVLDYAVKKFDGKGRLLERVGHRGYGPGEFRSPAYSVFCHDTLAVLQVQDPRIQIFDRDLSYLGEFSVADAMPIDIACTPCGWLGVAIIVDSAHGGVLLYPNMCGRFPRRILFQRTGKKHPLYGATRIGLCHDGTVVAAYLFMNRVELYTRTGRLLRQFTVPAMSEFIGDGEGTSVPEKTYIRRVLTRANGEIILVGGTEAPNPGRDLFVFNREGTYLGTRTLPEKSRVICVGEQGSLYAAEEFGTSIRKFLVH